MIEVVDITQGTPEWLALRCGVLTASNFSKVLAKGEGKVRKSLLLDMAAESLTGQPQDTFEDEWTRHGTVTEPEARTAYELVSGNTVRQIGFAFLDKHRLIGCSPDGLVDPDGLIESKCPKAKTHIEYVLAGKVPPQYVAQVQGALWVTGRSWCDFVSYCPSLAANPMMIVRVEPDADYIAKLKDECGQFLVALDELITNIKNA